MYSVKDVSYLLLTLLAWGIWPLDWRHVVAWRVILLHTRSYS